MINKIHLDRHYEHIHIQGYSLKPKENHIEEKQSSGTRQPAVVRPSQARFMACILLIFLPFIFAGCVPAKKNMLTLPIDSSQFTNYYSKDDSRFEFYLRPEYEKLANEFNSQEASVPRQGGIFYGPKKQPDLRYYEIGRFLIDDYLYKLVVFNRYEENDDLSLIIQLNSYNSEGIMLDALILENRFRGEDSAIFRQFKMEQNLISIEEYVTFFSDMNADPIIVMENPVPQVSSKAQYRIGNGRFILISKEDFKIAPQH